jgi:hypothetical protein
MAPKPWFCVDQIRRDVHWRERKGYPETLAPVGPMSVKMKSGVWTSVDVNIYYLEKGEV